MDNNNFYEYLQTVFTSTNHDLIVDPNSNIPGIDFEVKPINYNDERQKIQDLTASFPYLNAHKYIDANKVNLYKINSSINELFPKNKETREIFRSLDIIHKIKERYSFLQRKNDRINQLEDFIIDKAKNYLVDNINIYIDTLNNSTKKEQKINQIKRKFYGIRFNDKVQKNTFQNDSMTLYENQFVDIN